MPRTANNYEISSEHEGKHWLVPVARLENAALGGAALAADHYPTALLSRIPGTQRTGTVLSQETVGGADMVVVDVEPDMVYYHFVRNVRTYAGNVENAWGVIAIGDPIYFDRSATMPLGCDLSTSPLDNLGGANALFGFATFSQRVTMPTTAAGASTESIAVSQI